MQQIGLLAYDGSRFTGSTSKREACRLVKERIAAWVPERPVIRFLQPVVSSMPGAPGSGDTPIRCGSPECNPYWVSCAIAARK